MRNLRSTFFMKTNVLQVNPLAINVFITQKSPNWFAEQINCLVFLPRRRLVVKWWLTLISNRKQNLYIFGNHTTQKMKFSIKDFSSKCDQIRWKLRIISHLLEQSLMGNFIFCAVSWISGALSYYKYSGADTQRCLKNFSFNSENSLK